MRTRGHPVFLQRAASVPKSPPLLEVGKLSLHKLQEGKRLVNLVVWDVGEGNEDAGHHSTPERGYLGTDFKIEGEGKC